MNMYNALVMPYFKYCSTVWGNIGKKLLDKIKKKLQNRALKPVTFSLLTHPTPSRRNVHLLSVTQSVE